MHAEAPPSPNRSSSRPGTAISRDPALCAAPEGEPADDPHRRSSRSAGREAGAPSVSIEVASPAVPAAWTAWLEEHVLRAMTLLAAAGDVRIRLAGDDEVATAHQRFLGVEGTTDVITFDLSEPDQADSARNNPRPRQLDVDLLVCVDEGLRQAAARGIAPQHELLLYCLHGVLHCLGHDDHEPEAHRLMHEQEDRILEQLGVGALFTTRELTHATTPGPAGQADRRAGAEC